MKVFILLGIVAIATGFGTTTKPLRSSSVIRSNKYDMSMRWGLKGPQANKPMGELEDGVALRDKVPFELRGISLPLVVFSIGALLTGWSLLGFFITDGGGDSALSSLGFVYGIPVFLIGLSLWYAELPPVPVSSDASGDLAWENKSTDTLKKVRQDVTRHRYGDDAHLDSTLEALGLKLPQKKFPKLLAIDQSATVDGELVFTMKFQSADTPYKLWAEPSRVRRFEKFFGPGVIAAVSKVDKDKRILALTLTTSSTGASASAAADAPADTSVSDDDF